jgi:hypothetical protein
MMLRQPGMDILRRIDARYPHLYRLAWLALILVLAACNPGDNTGGGGGGGDGGPAY